MCYTLKNTFTLSHYLIQQVLEQDQVYFVGKTYHIFEDVPLKKKKIYRLAEGTCFTYELVHEHTRNLLVGFLSIAILIVLAE